MLRLKRHAPYVLAALALGVACASDPPPPRWLSERPPAFSDERWVVGVGFGPTDAGAAASATAAVAEATGGETEGATVNERWTDPKSGQRWAMVVMDREPLLRKLIDERSALDVGLVAATASLETEEPEEALRKGIRTREVFAKRDALEKRIVKLGGDAHADTELRAGLEANIAAAKMRLPINIASWEIDPKTGDARDPLDEPRRVLAQRVTERGFPVSTSEAAWGSDPAWILVELRIAFDALELHPRDRLVAIHWDVSLEITDPEGKVVAVLTQEGRSTHLNQREAERRARADAQDYAAGALDGWISARIGEVRGAP
jgi:hypothetical protein